MPGQAPLPTTPTACHPPRPSRPRPETAPLDYTPSRATDSVGTTPNPLFCVLSITPFYPQETPWFQPNLKVTDPEGWFYYCMVETRSQVKPSKGSRMRQVNLIMRTAVSREHMARRLKEAGNHGRATDLKTLKRQAKTGDLSRFWLEKR